MLTIFEKDMTAECFGIRQTKTIFVFVQSSLSTL